MLTLAYTSAILGMAASVKVCPQSNIHAFQMGLSRDR